MTEFNVFEHFKKHPHNWKCIRIRIQKTGFFEKQDKEKSQVFSIKNRIHFTVISREQLSNAQFFYEKMYYILGVHMYTKKMGIVIQKKICCNTKKS